MTLLNDVIFELATFVFTTPIRVLQPPHKIENFIVATSTFA